MQAGSRDRVDRRLAAILAADVVGYSRLMEAVRQVRRVCCGDQPRGATAGLPR